MLAAVLTDQPQQLEVAQVVEPEPAPGEVLLGVSACGICGSDLHIAGVIGSPGTILGHEITGIVEALGPDVDPGAWKVGQPVVARPLSGCGTCRWCVGGRPDHCDSFALIGLDRPGGFAERLAVSADELFALPTRLMGPELALVEPLAIARRALRRTALEAGEVVAISGAGPIGLATLVWARALGAGPIVISDPAASRRELALQLGADAAVDPREESLGEGTIRVTGGRPAAVVECSGRAETIAEGMDHVKVDGRVTIVGICLTTAEIVPFAGLVKELDLRFSLYYGKVDFTDTLDAIDAGALDPALLLTETVTLGQLPERFARLAEDPQGGKIAVTP